MTTFQQVKTIKIILFFVVFVKQIQQRIKCLFITYKSNKYNQMISFIAITIRSPLRRAWNKMLIKSKWFWCTVIEICLVNVNHLNNLIQLQRAPHNGITDMCYQSVIRSIFQRLFGSSTASHPKSLFGLCYHLVIVLKLICPQSDRIKKLLLHILIHSFILTRSDTGTVCEVINVHKIQTGLGGQGAGVGVQIFVCSFL
jgi:hypothetical protein